MGLFNLVNHMINLLTLSCSFILELGILGVLGMRQEIHPGWNISP